MYMKDHDYTLTDYKTIVNLTCENKLIRASIADQIGVTSSSLDSQIDKLIAFYVLQKKYTSPYVFKIVKGDAKVEDFYKKMISRDTSVDKLKIDASTSTSMIDKGSRGTSGRVRHKKILKDLRSKFRSGELLFIYDSYFNDLVKSKKSARFFLNKMQDDGIIKEIGNGLYEKQKITSTIEDETEQPTIDQISSKVININDTIIRKHNDANFDEDTCVDFRDARIYPKFCRFMSERLFDVNREYSIVEIADEFNYHFKFKKNLGLRKVSGLLRNWIFDNKVNTLAEENKKQIQSKSRYTHQGSKNDSFVSFLTLPDKSFEDVTSSSTNIDLQKIYDEDSSKQFYNEIEDLRHKIEKITEGRVKKSLLNRFYNWVGNKLNFK